MTTISTQAKHMPDFVCATPAIQHPPVTQHDPYQPLLALYLLRLVLGMKGKLSTETLEELFEGPLGRLTGLTLRRRRDRLDMDLDEALDDPACRMRKNRRLRSLQKRIANRLNQLIAEGMTTDAPLLNNIKWLAKEFKLSACDQELLVLALLLAGNQHVDIYLSNLDPYLQQTSPLDYLHLMTTRPQGELKKSLQADSPLCSNGWLDPKITSIASNLIMPPSLLSALFTKHASAKELRELFFRPIEATTLTIDAYPSLQDDLEVLIPYLQTASEHRQAGVNILIYGSSATGKWELARLLGQCVGITAYEIPGAKGDRPLEPQDRFAASKMAQYWLARQATKGVIVFEQADDVLPNRLGPTLFDDEDIRGGIDHRQMKEYMTNNPVPTIWLIKKPKTIEPSCLQHFDYALEVDQMPEALRQQRIHKATRKLSISSVWQQHLIKHPDLPLNQIEKAAAIARLSQSDIGLSAERIMEKVLNSHSQLFRRPPVFKSHQTVTGYDLRFTNTSIPLTDLLSGLLHNPRGNFCFYGTPGTGKTAFAKHLAEQLGLPILVKRTSDILDKYVGESEKNLAKMFKQAKSDGAILLLDEADSFLGDRREAYRNWEISQVNELLTQMEQFDGIFICTTNLIARLDTASLRRLDFKVKFDYLNAAQRWALFEQESQHLGTKLPADEASLENLKKQIERLTQLTPGDFAVLVRQARFRSEPLSPADMLNVLEQECLAKGEKFGKIGFVH